MRHADETILWTGSDGIRCVLVSYDESRYQLRLMRESGTVRADLFAGHTAALAASLEWQKRLETANARKT
jgi:hypothetical protein